MGAPVPKLSRIGRYEVSSVIGWGGMGTVYCATDPRIGRRVAIKVLAGGYSEDPDLLARFYREAKCTGSLQHQNIVTVYELGDQDGYPYLVMQYLEGESLDAVISVPRPPLSDFLSGYPPELEYINQKALARDREDRYGSAKDFAFDCQQLE